MRVSRQHGSPRHAVGAALERMFPGRRAALYRSGTAALFSLLVSRRDQLKKTSPRRFVLMSAYTCPDLAAAAVRAGYRVALSDTISGSTAMSPASIPVALEDCAAIILSNLYGIPEDLAPWQALAARCGALLIDDACQSALSSDVLGRVGARGDAVGLVSFGRGKAFSAAGGGALLLPADAEPGGGDEGSGVLAGVIESCYALALSLFGRPALYWIPQRLPFLRLGETKYEPEFSLEGRSAAAWLFALARLESADAFRAELRAGAVAWKHILGAGLWSPEASPIRYPLLCADAESKAALLREGAEPFGISGSYPKTLDDFPGLQPNVVYKDLSAAKDLAARIITLPVHRFVSSEDRRRAAELISPALISEVR